MSRVRIQPVTDERSALMDGALALIERSFEHRDRQDSGELRNEIEEKRLGVHSSYEFHLLAASRGDAVVGVAVGSYLAGVNSGFITYLAVEPEERGRRLAQRLRKRLIEAFRGSARAQDLPDLDFIIGEVRADNPWLKRLLRGGAIRFGLRYYHPGIGPASSGPGYVLYREPIAGGREPLDAATVRRTIYAIYRRAYRVRYPLQRPGFRAMLEELAQGYSEDR
jgi:ribosomal protein S18 acetylase RimI-like enzyme